MMINKKTLGGISLALILTTSVTPIYGASVEATPISIPLPITEDTEVNLESNLDYTTYEGIIRSVTKENGYVSVAIGDPEKGHGEAILNLSKETMLLDNNGNEINPLEIVEGTKITAYSRNDKYMLMIYPPSLTPEVAVIYNQNESPNFTYGSFDDKLLSDDKSLVLNIGDKTLITDIRNDKMSKTDLYNRNMLAFYTFVLESYPMQTTPTRVVVLDELDDLSHLILDYEIQEIIQEDNYYLEDIQMVPLRKISEKLDYTVSWNNENHSVLLEKDKNIILYIGKTDIHIQENFIGTMLYDETRGPNPDDDKFYITGAPDSSLEYEAQLKDNKTYVPISFIELLK